MRELDKVLDKNEKILWEGKPQFWPFLFSRSSPLVTVGVLWSGIMLIITLNALADPGPLKYIIFFMPHFWIGLVLIFGPLLYNALVYKHTYYAITDKRIIIQKGWIGRDFDIIDFDQITNAEVNVGVFDKAFGGSNTGSILVSTAGSFTNIRSGAVPKPYTMSNVTKPYDVFRFFKKVTYDVKSDLQYPNTLRPTANPGYQTKYDPNKK